MKSVDNLYDENNCPERVVCFDNKGKTFDRYTVLFTGEYTHLTGGVSWCKKVKNYDELWKTGE